MDINFVDKTKQKIQYSSARGYVPFKNVKKGLIFSFIITRAAFILFKTNKQTINKQTKQKNNNGIKSYCN